jgi:hypothetical protein
MLYMVPNGTWYGDTTKPFSGSVFQLTDQPDYTNVNTNKIYNTSNVGVFPTALATFSQMIRPSRKDSVKIRLPDAIGQDFYSKLQTKANQMTNETTFLDYFRGLCVRPGTDTGAVYGFNVSDSSVRMTLHYHLTLPYHIDKTLDFILTRTSYQFNRIITDRNNTSLKPVVNRQQEFFASNQNPYAFTQSGTGVLLKAKFPGLRDLLKINEIVRLMSAKLILRPIKGTYDDNAYKLPNQLFLAQTDLSNNIGPALLDTTGSGIQYRDPVIDRISGIDTYYNFDVTAYVNSLFNTPGSAEGGVFILQSDPNSATQISRAVIGSSQNPNANFQTKLVLNLLTID